MNSVTSLCWRTSKSSTLILTSDSCQESVVFAALSTLYNRQPRVPCMPLMWTIETTIIDQPRVPCMPLMWTIETTIQCFSAAQRFLCQATFATSAMM